MTQVNYISHLLEDNVEDIKALALYFDKITIIEQRHLHLVVPVDAKPDASGRVKAEAVTTSDFTEQKFISHLKELEQSNVIQYRFDIDSGGTSPHEGYYPASSDMQISNLVLHRVDFIGEKLKSEEGVDKNGYPVFTYEILLNKEAERLCLALFPTNRIKRLSLYYARVLKTFINYYEKGENVLTSSKYVNDLFNEISKTDRFKSVQQAFKNEFKVSPSIAFEAIKLSVPNLAKFPTEEILRFKDQSKNELLEFKTKLESLTFDLLNNYDEEYIIRNAQNIADIKIKPLIENISNTLNSSKFKAIQELIREAKDPKSYSPLLLTLSDKISNTMALFISLGMISLNAGLENYSRIKEAKKDGIYYLYKLKKYFD